MLTLYGVAVTQLRNDVSRDDDPKGVDAACTP
jgi:hypothetical protein